MGAAALSRAVLLVTQLLTPSSLAPHPLPVRVQQMNSELFGGGDAVVKYVLEGHDRWVGGGEALS